MSNLTRLTNNAYRIRKLMLDKGLDAFGNGRKPNEILVAFLKEHKLKYVKWNPRYKGFFTAELSNACTVQDNIELFKVGLKTFQPCTN
jgi:hypothetical protein